MVSPLEYAWADDSYSGHLVPCSILRSLSWSWRRSFSRWRDSYAVCSLVVGVGLGLGSTVSGACCGASCTACGVWSVLGARCRKDSSGTHLAMRTLAQKISACFIPNINPFSLNGAPGLMIRKLFLKMLGARWYSWLLLSVLPYIRFTTYYTSLRGSKYWAAYYNLKPGHIILTVDRRKLTTLLVPGVMTHAALCVNKRFGGWATDYEVAEMTHTNYTASDFFDICKESDRVVILACADWSDASYIDKVISSCKSLAGAKYDVEFEFGVDALYCSELVYQADKLAGGRLKVDLSDLAGLGREYISPDGLACGYNVWCVYDTDGVWNNLTGPDIRKLIHG